MPLVNRLTNNSLANEAIRAKILKGNPGNAKKNTANLCKASNCADKISELTAENTMYKFIILNYNQVNSALSRASSDEIATAKRKHEEAITISPTAAVTCYSKWLEELTMRKP